MPFKWKYDNTLYKKITTFLWYSFESCSFGIAFGFCIVRFKCLGGSSWTFFAGLVFFSLFSFKSVSILSSRIVCVLIQFGLWPINQFSMIFGIDETWIFAETYTFIYLCSLGQVNHGCLYERYRSSFIVSGFDRRSGILALLLLLFFVTNTS